MSCCFIESQNHRTPWTGGDPQGSSPCTGQPKDPSVGQINLWGSVWPGLGMCISHLPLSLPGAAQEPQSCLPQQLPRVLGFHEQWIPQCLLCSHWEGLWGQLCLDRISSWEPWATKRSQRAPKGRGLHTFQGFLSGVFLVLVVVILQIHRGSAWKQEWSLSNFTHPFPTSDWCHPHPQIHLSTSQPFSPTSLCCPVNAISKLCCSWLTQNHSSLHGFVLPPQKSPNWTKDWQNPSGRTSACRRRWDTWLGWLTQWSWKPSSSKLPCSRGTSSRAAAGSCRRKLWVREAFILPSKKSKGKTKCF